MILKRYNGDVYWIKPESSFDLLNLRLLLLHSDILFCKQLYTKKYEQQTKADCKKKSVWVKMSAVKSCAFKDFKTLRLTGQIKSAQVAVDLRVLQQFYLCKKLSKKQKLFLRTLKTEKTFYLGVDVNTVVLGYTLDYEFVKIKQNYYNFKQKDLKTYLLSYLDSVKPLVADHRVVYKCPALYRADFIKWTGLQWQVLLRDVLLDSQLSNEKVKKQMQFIKQCMCRKNLVFTAPQALKEMEINNCKAIYLCPAVSLDFYNTASVTHPESIRYLPLTKRLTQMLPQGFLLVKYF